MFLFILYRQCIKCVQITFMDSNIQVQTVGLYVLKSIFQRELGESANMENNSFILFFAGELLGDIFSLICKIWEKLVTRESLVIAGECLRLLVLLHALSQASECQKDVMNLLLEAIIMVVSVSTEAHSQVVKVLTTVYVDLLGFKLFIGLGS
ncbi:protein SWEETIE-like [Magnolia sinica]|uniref:protein SWEETIE-like n=1 Tax=Magnolia sinica TaxID=86752 RepID=UPI0026599D49|nr:protein SWEETIE-like [Magnolia sinica]